VQCHNVCFIYISFLTTSNATTPFYNYSVKIKDRFKAVLF